MGLRAVREHGPDLSLAIARGFKDDVAAVGRPTGALVLTTVARDLNDLARGPLHDVDVVIAVGAAPTKGDHLAVGRPGRIDEGALLGQVATGVVAALSAH